MYLIYIDESGKPDYSNPEPEFLLASLTINEEAWSIVDKKVVELKKKYFPEKDPAEIEFHATDIFNHTKHFKNVSLDTRLALFGEIMHLISETDCVITAVMIRKDLLVNREQDINSKALEYLFERLCYLLEEKNKTARDKGAEYGLLMIDSVNPKYDNKVRLIMRGLLKSGTKFEKNRFIIEDPIFVDSSYRHLSQLADCVAYCLRRKFRAKEPSVDTQKQFDDFFKIIEEKLLRKSSRTSGYGIKIYPEKM
ncbi:MAG: DUF3800 domain-containing protein [Candidatus Methanomethylophilaceae archaeon]|nr:DUF3800 domain-containing protein [Candidatus Methanomethylophilaceae archaeon]